VAARRNVLPRVVLGGVVSVLLASAASLALLPVQEVPPAVVGELPAPTRAVATTGEIDAEAAPPRRLTIARLGIEGDLAGLRVLADGTLEVPEDPDQIGWHQTGTAPGDIGPAVVVGHVDSYEGGAVFFRLRELQPGDRVDVQRTDGSTVGFEVYGTETVRKDAFPSDRVYGTTAGPELRLITCGGLFDEAARSYTENIVVYAREIAAPVPS
jgi:hypothetical protein